MNIKLYLNYTNNRINTSFTIMDCELHINLFYMS